MVLNIYWAGPGGREDQLPHRGNNISSNGSNNNDGCSDLESAADSNSSLRGKKERKGGRGPRRDVTVLIGKKAVREMPPSSSSHLF